MRRHGRPVPRRVAVGDLSAFVGLYSDDRRLPLKGPDGTESKDRSYTGVIGLTVVFFEVSREGDPPRFRSYVPF